MSFGSTVVSVVTVTVPVAGTLTAGYIVQRSERLKRREELTAAEEAADRAAAAAQTEASAKAIADIMTTGLAWRRALAKAEVAMRDRGRIGVASRMQVDIEELTNAQAAFGTAVFTALAMTTISPAFHPALSMLEDSYEDGFDAMRSLAEDGANEWGQTAEVLNNAVARGMTALQEATRPAGPTKEVPH